MDTGIQGVCSQVRRLAKAREVGRQKERSVWRESSIAVEAWDAMPEMVEEERESVSNPDSVDTLVSVLVSGNKAAEMTCREVGLRKDSTASQGAILGGDSFAAEEPTLVGAVWMLEKKNLVESVVVTSATVDPENVKDVKEVGDAFWGGLDFDNLPSKEQLGDVCGKVMFDNWERP